MEIHELNNFSGTPGANDYLATDNGTDTSKISVKAITDPLDARIDNIIAGGDAPSTAEVTDARLGATVLGGQTYASLGAAIRTQATELFNDSSYVKEDLLRYDVYSISEKEISRNNGTHNDVTYNWSGRICTVSGTSTGTSVNILVSKRALPTGLVAGGQYPVKYKTTNSNVTLGFVFYNSSNVATYKNFTGNVMLTVPSDAVQWALRLYVESGKSANATVSEIAVLNIEPFETGIYIDKDKYDNSPAGLTYFQIAYSFDSDNRATPADIPINSYCIVVGSRLGAGWFEGKRESASYLIMCLANLYNPTVREYFVIPVTNNIPLWRGNTGDSGSTVTWLSANGSQELKVLCIGSSFGQDSVVYAPFIMDELTQNINCTMGIAYSSGASIDNYSTWFDSDTAVSYYKRKLTANAWSSAESKSVKEILTDEKWDIILFNQSAYDGGVESTFSNFNSLIDKVANYVMSQNEKSVKFGYTMPQRALGYASRYTYADMISCVEHILDTTPIEFFIPCGTAIETARGTSLNSIGDSGGLTYDSTGHLQEGLPVLLSSYVTALKLLELCGINNVGVMGNTIRPTAAWVTSHAIPGQNGTSTGVTDSNCLLAQKCAIAAIKKPTETSVIA